MSDQNGMAVALMLCKMRPHRANVLGFRIAWGRRERPVLEKHEQSIWKGMTSVLKIRSVPKWE